MELIMLSHLKFETLSPTASFFLHHQVEMERLQDSWPYDVSIVLVNIFCHLGGRHENSREGKSPNENSPKGKSPNKQLALTVCCRCRVSSPLLRIELIG